MGMDLTADQEQILERINAPADRDRVIAQPQLPIQFRLDTLEEWIPVRMPYFEPMFKALRVEWCLRQEIPQDKSILHHEILQTFENIAHTFDGMVHSPGMDILSTIDIFKGTDSEQALVVRPLGSWINGYQNALGVRIP